MDTFQYMFYLIALILIFSFAFGFFKKLKEVNELKERLKNIMGESETEFYKRGKFTELGLMSAGITHEISNPLTIILGHVRKLTRTKLDSGNKIEFQNGIAQIKKNAERIASVIESVRNYIYRNDKETEEFMSLIDIINNVVVFFDQRLKNHGIDLRIKNIDQIYISGNKGELEQALLNLLNNSFDAVDKLPEKWIEISAIKTQDNVKIFVKDSGSGISSEVRSKMFNPFFSTKTNHGSGLGLPLVKVIAQKHGGELKYIGGKNTTFMIELPQASSAHYHY